MVDDRVAFIARAKAVASLVCGAFAVPVARVCRAVAKEVAPAVAVGRVIDGTVRAIPVVHRHVARLVVRLFGLRQA